MSEMDDELKKMLETPEEQMRRTNLADQEALQREQFTALYTEALSEDDAFNDRRWAAMEAAKTDRKAVMRNKYRWPRRIGAGVLGLVVVSGAVVGGTAAVEGLYQQDIASSADAQALQTVEGLRAHGACFIELDAEAKLAAVEAKYANNSFYRQEKTAVSLTYRSAAQLALKYGVSCTPKNSKADSLTPNFDVALMKINHSCSDEYIAAKVDPNTANNGVYKNKLEVQDGFDSIAAAIATKEHIAC